MPWSGIFHIVDADEAAPATAKPGGGLSGGDHDIFTSFTTLEPAMLVRQAYHQEAANGPVH